jgi:phosphate transport system substrate-binding protein
MALFGATVAAAAATDIDGSGSTFVQPILLRWASAYNVKTGVKVNFQSIGSGAGILQIKAGRVVFGASDVRATNPSRPTNSMRRTSRSFLWSLAASFPS